MLRMIIRHEFKLLFARDRTVWVVAAVFLGFLAYALSNGVMWERSQRETIANLDQEEQQRLAAVAEELRGILAGAEPDAPWTDPRAPSVLGGGRGARHAALEPGPLTSLAVGQSDLLPYYYTVSIWTNDQSFLQNGEIENPINLMAGRFDLAFIVVFLLPLLVLALTYNVLSGERESGTLALTLSQPVGLPTVIVGKVAVRAAVVLLAALGISVIGALLVSTTTGTLPWGALLLWTAAVVAYAAFWFVLAMIINAFGRPSSWNAMALIGAWLLLVVVVPVSVNIAANLLHPLPSRVEMITAQREASDEAVRERTALLARYYEDHPEMAQGTPLDTTNTAAAGYAAQQEVNRRMAEVVDRYDARLEAQRRIVSRYRFLSPALLAHEALHDAAGTGDARFHHFEEQVAQYADEWKAFFVPPLLAGETMQPDDVVGSPAFRYVEEPFGAVVARAALPVGILVILCGVAGAEAVRRLRRYRLAE